MEMIVVLLAGLSLGMSVLSLVAIFKLGNGVCIRVEVKHPPTAPVSPPPDLRQEDVEKLLRERSTPSLDTLIQTLNEYLVGGDTNGNPA